MNGLLAKKPPGEPAADEEATPAVPMDGAEGEESNVTPEEQAAYEQFVSTAMTLIYDPKMREGILDRLGATDQPMDDLANTAVMVVKRVQAAAEQAGDTIDETILFHGGKAVLEDLAEYATTKGVHDFTKEELEGAWYRALDLYREMGQQDGTLDPEGLKGEFEQINAADQEGRLNEMLPGIDQVKAPAGEAPPEDEPVEDDEAPMVRA